MQMEPVGVFWDIENCRIPEFKSAFALANKMRKMFFEGKREAEFVCVCDITKENRRITDELNKSQVCGGKKFIFVLLSIGIHVTN